jgi:hypothetical protein
MKIRDTVAPMLRVLILTTIAATAGCGPIEYVTIVTFQAQKAVANARRLSADKLAPYEYTLAVESLHKARELAGYARWEDAVRFGKTALAQGDVAATLAQEKRARPEERGE